MRGRRALPSGRLARLGATLHFHHGLLSCPAVSTPVLLSYGWGPFFAEAFAPYAPEGLVPGRVTREHRGLLRVQAEDAEYVAEVAGRLRHEARGRADLPAVGDWVALRRPVQGLRATVQAVLPRRSRFARKAAGEEHDAQVAAANVDTVFLVTGLDRDFNLRRIERYLVLAWESGARPVVLLNKADLSEDAEDARAQVEAVAAGAPVHVIAAREGRGLEALLPYLQPRQTIALLGSSGAGKSTLLNRLAGTEQATREVRASDSRGRHTTTHRQIFVLPQGALMVDTPGMRELQLWEAESGIEAAFDDVEALGAACRFTDCAHGAEPGCAVQAAVAEGRLDAGRFESYLKLRREQEHVSLEQDKRARSEANRKLRSLHRLARRHNPRG
jgi:ribosome biogenesis GTPase